MICILLRERATPMPNRIVPNKMTAADAIIQYDSHIRYEE